MKSLWISSCLLILCVTTFTHAVKISGTKQQEQHLSPSAHMSAVFAEIDAQVEQQINQKQTNAPPKDTAANALLNVGLKNMLDLKAISLDVVPGSPSTQPRHVIAAFSQIAWEAVQRGKFAIAHLTNMYESAKSVVKANDHNLKAWISNHLTISQNRIRTEEERVGKLTDEVNHLQHVYQDAVAKEKSYQEQSSHLVSERQLQSTPPLIPAVAAAAMTDAQYEAVIQQLAQYRESAMKIMQEAAVAISTRQHLIEQGSEWIKTSKKSLRSWLEKQNDVAKKRLEEGKKQLAQLQNRINNVKVIAQDAQNYYNDYMNALQRVDVQLRVAVLEKERENYKNVTLTNAYDKAKMNGFLEAIKLEIDAMKDKLSKMNGTSEVLPPPAAWGVLAGFNPPAIHNNMIPSPVYRVQRPDGSNANYLYSPPGGVYYHDPSVVSDFTSNLIDQKRLAQESTQVGAPFTATNVPITIPNSILAPMPSIQFGADPAAAAAAAKPAADNMPKFREQEVASASSSSSLSSNIPPPSLPDFPEPPNMDV